MSYTYLAVYEGSGTPAAAFPLKHQLERWLGQGGPFRNDSLELFRVRSAPWDEDSIVVELEFDGESLIEKVT